ncbi:DNA methyltransferase [Candidatus Mycalebacterium sp.]
MFKNQTIWTGDNLPILRGLEDDCVDLIYLDPPFNSNRTYSAPIGSEAAGAAFKDTWTLSDVDNAWHGEIAEKTPAVYEAISASELTHSKGMKSYLIMMAVRLMEMKRILKPTGNIYLHCDPTASHYLKMLMDSVFGKNNFRGEIVWKRTDNPKGLKTGRKSYGVDTDSIFCYAKSDECVLYLDNARKPLSEKEMSDKYKHKDEYGNYYPGPITLSGSMGRRPNQEYEYKGYRPDYGWRMVRSSLEKLDVAGNLGWNNKGNPFRKLRPSENKGHPLKNLWDDIARLSSQSKERIGYPTQKPLALLERIILASSKKGDIVLDPFCGCATALIAAEKLNRRWIGIDLSEKAVDLVKIRMKKETTLFDRFNLIHRTDIPKRKTGAENYRDPDKKKFLYGRQEGKCTGCRVLFPYRNMTVDHIVSQSDGGGHEIENLQLLCGACNSTKGAGTQEQLIVKLKDAGVQYR